MARLAKSVCFLSLTFLFAVFATNRYVVHYDVAAEKSIRHIVKEAGYVSSDDISEPDRTDIVNKASQDASAYAMAKLGSLWLPAYIIVLIALLKLFSTSSRPGPATILAVYVGLLALSVTLVAIWGRDPSLSSLQKDVFKPLVLLGPVAAVAFFAVLLGHWSLDGPTTDRAKAVDDAPGGGAGSKPVRPRSKAPLILLPGAVLALGYGGYSLHGAQWPLDLGGWSGPSGLYRRLDRGVNHRISELRAAPVTLPKGGDALVVRGKLVNLPPRSRGRVSIRLVDGESRILAAQEVAPGVSFSDADLSAQGVEKIRKRLVERPVGRPPPPRGSVPFAAVFSPVPGGVRRVEAVVIPDRFENVEPPVVRFLMTRVAEAMGASVRPVGDRPAGRARAVPAVEKRPGAARIQARLNHLGYGAGPVDGIAGRRTRAALRAFQERNGLPVSGKADAATLERLFSGNAARAGASALSGQRRER